ncbi:tyrosine-type recombinase/integrase [Peribacillus simplex]|uniref:tyrosine-type recombinase/integrase n=1 Tax=Peribacillus simplex TaxID=1478 RepID=UPI00366BF98D
MKERDFAILSLFLGSGNRVNELSNLRLQDLDYEEKQIHVLRKGGKKDVASVSPLSMQDIKDYIDLRTERYRGSNDDAAYVFLTRVNDGATPLSNRAIEALVKKYTKAYKSNKSMSPHKLRYSYTNLMEQSGDIHLLMTQLGHTSTITAALYTNSEKEKAKKAGKKKNQLS